MRTGKDRVQVEAMNGPVNIGDARVLAGDLLRGDADGVVVIPKAHENDVLTISDHWTLTKIDAPEGLLLVPGAELMVDPVVGPMCPEFLAIGIDDGLQSK